jgi:hypothetical protein
MPSKDGDLYFGVESYYSSMYPLSCTEYLLPEVKFILSKNDEVIKAMKYDEDRQKPILVREEDYDVKDNFTISIQYNWHWSTARDFTVTIYSRQHLEIVDWKKETYEIYMDGDTPNGFTKSNFRREYPERLKSDKFGPKSLGDTFRGAHDFWNW